MTEVKQEELPQKMTREQISRLGELAVSKNKEYMRELGRKGQAKRFQDKVLNEAAVSEYMREIGRKGGHATSRDKQFMSEIGKKGAAVRTENLRKKQKEGTP
jgi:general stress protein YciG